MSDFLNKFTKENYDKDKMKLGQGIPKENPSFKSLEVEEKIEETQELITESLISNQYEDYDHDDTEYIEDEPLEVDPGYKKKRRKKIILATVIGLIAAVSIYFILVNNSVTTMPNFENSSKQDVILWANRYKIHVIYDELYSLDVDEDMIIKQSVEAEEKIKKGSSLNISVSLGADPDEQVSIPEFETMSAQEIDAWIKDQKMRYITLESVFSKEVEKDKFIDFVITDKDVTKEKFLRKNKATLRVSKGPEVYEKNISVPDFKGKSTSEIEMWKTEKEIVSKFVFEEVYDDKIVEGEVLSQSVSSGEKIAKDDVITFTVSKGRAQKVPNYASSELSTFDTINSNGATVLNKEIYSMNIAYGSFISQSIAPGTILNDNPEAVVIVYYSIGKPYLKDLIGQSEGDLPSYFYDFKGKGAAITYSVNRVSSCETKGTVVDASANNEYVGISSHINVYISDGAGVCVSQEE